MTAPLRVKAAAAYTRDVGRCIARIDPKSIEELDLSGGDFVEIRGSGRTAAKCLPLYPNDWAAGITRTDALVRYNAGVSLGDEVDVTKAQVRPARSLLVTPLGEGARVVNMFIEVWQEGDKSAESRFASEALSGTPVATGDSMMIDYSGYRLLLLVLEKEPAEGISVVSRNTRMDVVPGLTA